MRKPIKERSSFNVVSNSFLTTMSNAQCHLQQHTNNRSLTYFSSNIFTAVYQDKQRHKFAARAPPTGALLRKRPGVAVFDFLHYIIPAHHLQVVLYDFHLFCTKLSGLPHAPDWYLQTKNDRWTYRHRCATTNSIALWARRAEDTNPDKWNLRANCSRRGVRTGRKPK